MQINITEIHIKNGKMKDKNLCPIAIALTDTFGHKSVAFVGINKIIIESNKFSYTISPNDAIKKFITQFDNNEAVTPFSFNINLDLCICDD